MIMAGIVIDITTTRSSEIELSFRTYNVTQVGIEVEVAIVIKTGIEVRPLLQLGLNVICS